MIPIPAWQTLFSTKPAGGSSGKTIASVAGQTPLTVGYGNDYSNLNLPDQVTVTLNDASTTDLFVSWAQGTYDKFTLGTYALTGTILLVTGITNPLGVTASINVTVQAGLVVAIDAQTEVDVAYGTAFGSVSLPSQVNVTLDSGYELNINVSWAAGSYDSITPASYNIVGTLTSLPAYVVNTNSLTSVVVVVVLPYNDSGLPNTKALWQAVGAGQAIDIGNITVPWPTHAANDIGFLLVETTPADSAPADPSGWTLISHVSNTSGSTQTRLSVWYRRALSSSETSPVLASPGNHIYGVITTMRGAYQNLSPIDVTTTASKAVSTAVSIAGVTASQNGNDILYIASRGSDAAANQYSGEANANLTGLTERFDNGTTLANGGGLGVWSGNLASAGASGTLTATLAVTSIECYMVIALKGVNNYSAPTSQANNLVLVGDRQVNFDKATGSLNTLVVYNIGGAVSFTPVDGTSYTVGQSLGSGNFVLSNDANSLGRKSTAFPFSSTIGLRAFAWNTSGSGPKYNTSSGTNNPVTPTSLADEAWYLYHDTPMMTRRTPFDLIGLPTNSRSCTQIYAIGVDENSTHLFVYAVTEGDFDGGIDRSVRMVKTKADGLPITQGWSFESFSGNGDPTSFLDQGPDTFNAYQNWGLQSVVDLGGGSKYGYYVANQSSANRYSVGLMTSSDDGETWARFGTTAVIPQGSGKSYFYVKVLKDGADWWAFVQNYNPGALVEGHLFVGEIHHSTDGKSWVKQTTTDVFSGRNLTGAVDIGQPWKDTGKYYAYLTINNPGVTGGYQGNSSTNITTNPTGKIIALISWTDWTTFNSSFVIERVIFTDSQAVDIDIRAYAAKQTFGGQDFVWTMSFLWRAQTGLGAILEPFNNGQILTKGLVTGAGGQTIGREVYPGYVAEVYLPHQSYLNDNVTGTPVQPKAIIAGTNGSIVGTPQISKLNSIFPNAAGFVTFPNYTYDKKYNGFKIKVQQTNTLSTSWGICGMDTDVVGGTRGWRIEKTGAYTFKITVYKDGDSTKYKQYEVSYVTYGSQLDKSKFAIIGFLWQNGNLKVCVDLETNATVTKIRDDVFTDMQQTNEPLRIGAIYPTTNSPVYAQDLVGTAMRFDGVANATESNWLNNDLV